jgi:hypothetical protein
VQLQEKEVALIGLLIMTVDVNPITALNPQSFGVWRIESNAIYKYKLVEKKLAFQDRRK